MSDLKGPDIRLSIIIICSGVLDVYLLLGLRQYSIFYKKIRGIPFIAYIALLTGKYFFLLIFSFIDHDNPNAEEFVLDILIFLPAILFALATSIMEYIVGLKLKDELPEASNVGITLIGCGITGILLTLISFGTTGDLQQWVYLGRGICLIAFYYYLKNLFTRSAEINNS